MTNDERESPRKAIRNWLSRVAKVRLARISANEDDFGVGLDGHHSAQRPTRQQGPTNEVVKRHSRKTGVESVQSPKGNGRTKYSYTSTPEFHPADYDGKMLRLPLSIMITTRA